MSKGNHERPFDDARRRVRAWERHPFAVREVPEAKGAPMRHSPAPPLRTFSSVQRLLP